MLVTARRGEPPRRLAWHRRRPRQRRRPVAPTRQRGPWSMHQGVSRLLPSLPLLPPQASRRPRSLKNSGTIIVGLGPRLCTAAAHRGHKKPPNGPRCRPGKTAIMTIQNPIRLWFMRAGRARLDSSLPGHGKHCRAEGREGAKEASKER
ncbi:hypothetical protein E2C01_040635 [Portunus trituberculatus]|uniref:Uncharacterized protein n=1 Tax=Portunus trituberculatus TaxID=210409 RepID=A0A5B7FRB1_PORTR|nr:hypothetical protein [Portunus trituberculatus]